MHSHSTCSHDLSRASYNPTSSTKPSLIPAPSTFPSHSPAFHQTSYRVAPRGVALCAQGTPSLDEAAEAKGATKAWSESSSSATATAWELGQVTSLLSASASRV